MHVWFPEYRVVQISEGGFENGVLADDEGAYVAFGFPRDEAFEVVIESPLAERVAVQLTLRELNMGAGTVIEGASVDFDGAGLPDAVTVPSEDNGTCGDLF